MNSGQRRGREVGSGSFKEIVHGAQLHPSLMPDAGPESHLGTERRPNGELSSSS